MNRADQTYWVTKDGDSLLISKMETSHIQNCIDKILRSPTDWRRELLDVLAEELTKRLAGAGTTPRRYSAK